MRYSIITPTVCRVSLAKLCESLDRQTCRDWQHIVIVDVDSNRELLREIRHPSRQIVFCNKSHMNFGNTCRHNAYVLAEGDYIYYADDDNYFADDRALERLEVVNHSWAIFPIIYHGEFFFHDPPAVNQTDTANFIVRRRLGRWFNVENYEADGMLAAYLLRLQYQYQSLPELAPVMIVPASLCGDFDGRSAVLQRLS